MSEEVREEIRSEEELAITGGSEKIPEMTDGREFVGHSGTRYRMVNFITEMTARHRRHALKIIGPVLSLFEAASGEMQAGSGSQAEANQRMLMKLDLTELIGMLRSGGDIDVQFLATIYLPVNDRKWPSDERIAEEKVKERMADFEDWTLEKTIGVVKSFFTSIGSSFASIS